MSLVRVTLAGWQSQLTWVTLAVMDPGSWVHTNAQGHLDCSRDVGSRAGMAGTIPPGQLRRLKGPGTPCQASGITGGTGSWRKEQEETIRSGHRHFLRPKALRQQAALRRSPSPADPHLSWPTGLSWPCLWEGVWAEAQGRGIQLNWARVQAWAQAGGLRCQERWAQDSTTSFHLHLVIPQHWGSQAGCSACCMHFLQDSVSATYTCRQSTMPAVDVPCRKYPL